MTQQGAIDFIARQPEGRILLFVMAVGIGGYSVWGVIRAVFDPMGRGNSPLGIFQRLGYLTSGLAYASLLVSTLRYLVGKLRDGHSADHSASLLANPMGPVIVVIVGVCWVFGAGVMQIAQGWKASFERDLDHSRMSRTEERWALVLGRTGMISRGVVFAVIGVLLIASAAHAHPRLDVGMDGALMQILRRPYGRLLLVASGMGLMAFGCFSAMCARWLRIPSPAPGSLVHDHPSLQ